MREAAVRLHLHRRVKQLGGDYRCVKWLGRDHAPDDLILLPGRHVLVEAKRPGEGAAEGQAREHERLRASGFEVLLLDTIEKVDAAFPPPEGK